MRRNPHQTERLRTFMPSMIRCETAQLESARQSLDQASERDAIQSLQQLIDSPHDSLTTNADGWTSLAGSAEHLVGSLSDAGRRLYQEMYGAVAQQALQKAERTQTLEDLASVTRQYFHTSAGYAAADRIGTLLMDRGDLRGARWWMSRLLDAQAPITRSPHWQKKAAHAGVRPPDSAAIPAVTSRMPDDHIISPFTMTQALTDWKMPFGSSVNIVQVPEGHPLPIPRWSIPLTSRYAIREQVELLQRDLQDMGRACIPASIPLAVGERVVFRTLQGLAVADAQTGSLLWESPADVSIEHLLSGEPVIEPGITSTAQSPRAVSSYFGNSVEMDPLAHFLYEDGVYGLISSDGEQVFALGRHATLSYRQPGLFWQQQRQTDPFDREWSTNQLMAFDLGSGELNWIVGERHAKRRSIHRSQELCFLAHRCRREMSCSSLVNAAAPLSCMCWIDEPARRNGPIHWRAAAPRLTKISCAAGGLRFPPSMEIW